MPGLDRRLVVRFSVVVNGIWLLGLVIRAASNSDAASAVGLALIIVGVMGSAIGTIIIMRRNRSQPSS
jgi:hypothetical protein